MSNYSCTNANTGDVLTKETLLESIKKLKDMEPQGFLLIAPDGYAYKGDAAQIASVLFKFSPFFMENALKKENT